MFCPKCKSLLLRKNVRGASVNYCPQCDGGGPADKHLPLIRRQSTLGGGPPSRDAGRGAPAPRPPPSGGSGSSSSRSRARAEVEASRKPRDIPPPDKIRIPPGMNLFPFDTIRDGQRQFIADVDATVKRGGHLLAHAPTGLGKTVSTLAPLLAYALEHDKRVFFLTSKQSQHKIAIDTLKAIRQRSGLSFVVSDVIGKQDMCPRREARDLFPKRFSDFCRNEQVNHTCQYWEAVNTPAIKVLKARVHSVEELVMQCTDTMGCPHSTALDLAAQAHVVICDYNYFFSDLRETMQERLKLDLSDIILVVDEAHNLPDRIRDHLTLSLDGFLIGDAIAEAKEIDETALVKHLEMLDETVASLAEERTEFWAEEQDRQSGGKGERFVPKGEFLDALNTRLTSKVSTLFHSDYEGLVGELKDAASRYESSVKTESRGLLEVLEFLNNWRFERRGIARILTSEPTTRLSYKILDPAILAKPVFDAVHASVIMSGTLHPMDMMRDVLGLDPAKTELREYASPFPPQNRLVVIDSAVTTGYKERTRDMFQSIGERLAGIARATPGNVAAFFPSYGILEQVRPYVEEALLGHKDLIVEERGLDKSEKEALVGRMRRLTTDDALLMGVQGGSLSEGYDYEDNLLKGVVIVGLPFAAPTLDVESLIEYYDKKFGAGHGRPYAYVHPAFHRVLQAAGRCIRSPDDRGVIVLMDKRFGWGSYQASYPRDFRPRGSQDPVSDVTFFWSTRS